MINYADGREYDLVFDEEKHSYTVDGEKVHSVTRVIDACFPKHLVDWAVDEGVKAYQNEMDKVPSKDGLYELEQTHAELIEERIKTAYKEKGDHAANIGNIVHEWIRNRINGDDADPWRDTHVNACQNAFLEWEASHEIEWIDAERKVYAYDADEGHRYAGTVDAVAIVDEHPFVIDFKTSKKIYKEYYLQVAAYAKAVWQMGDYQTDYDGMILRLDKETGKFQEKAFNAWEHYEMFVNCMDLKNWNSKRIKEIKYV